MRGRPRPPPLTVLVLTILLTLSLRGTASASLAGNAASPPLAFLDHITQSFIKAASPSAADSIPVKQTTDSSTSESTSQLTTTNSNTLPSPVSATATSKTYDSTATAANKPPKFVTVSTTERFKSGSLPLSLPQAGNVDFATPSAYRTNPMSNPMVVHNMYDSSLWKRPPTIDRLDVPLSHELTKNTPYSLHREGIQQLPVGHGVWPEQPTPYQKAQLSQGSLEPVGRMYPVTTSSLLEVEEGRSRHHLRGSSRHHLRLKSEQQFFPAAIKSVLGQLRGGSISRATSTTRSGSGSGSSAEPESAFPTKLAPLGHRPQPPSMLRDPSKTQTAAVVASLSDHPPSKLEQVAREDHEGLFGPIDRQNVLEVHPRAPLDPDRIPALPMANNVGSGSDAALIKSIPKPLAPMVWSVHPAMSPTDAVSMTPNEQAHPLSTQNFRPAGMNRRGPFDEAYTH